MADIPSGRVFYRGGHAGADGLGVLAGPVDNPDGTESTIFYLLRGDTWARQELPFAVSSLTHLAHPDSPDAGWWLVGKRGEVAWFGGGAPRIERIATGGTGDVAKKFGYLSQIRVIDGTLFICGYRRQVYRRDGGQWRLISDPIIDRRDKGPWNGFESIDGFARDDLYAVGDDGEIWHFDGAAWRACDSPTNQNLAEVRCIDGQAWICGDRGIVLRGDKDGWQVVWDRKSPSENWWSLERFGDRMYLAGNEFLGVLQDGGIDAVDVGLPEDEEITTMVLHARDGVLWSVGEEHILSWDGSRWTRWVAPENR
jgi:hypothetical protein